MRILDVFLQQLGKSNTLKILALILVASAIGRILTENWYFDYSIFASGYFLLFIVSIAARALPLTCAFFSSAQSARFRLHTIAHMQPVPKLVSLTLART